MIVPPVSTSIAIKTMPHSETVGTGAGLMLERLVFEVIDGVGPILRGNRSR